MEGIRHQVPIDLVGAHAGSVLASEEISAGRTRRGAAQAGAATATHRRFERQLDGRKRNPLATGRVAHGGQHRRWPTREDVNAPSLTLPRKRGREKRHDRAVLAGAAVVGGEPNLRALKSVSWEQM